MDKYQSIHDLSSSLLFIHAMSGCDSTSRPYGIGKVSTMNKYQSIQSSTRIFMMPNRTHEEIEKAGNEALAIIYSCKLGKDLNFECASRFFEKVVSSSCYLPPEHLPPTSDAARFHSYRVYFQVHAWLGEEMEPTEWSWDIQKTKYSSILKPTKWTKLLLSVKD